MSETTETGHFRGALEWLRHLTIIKRDSTAEYVAMAIELEYRQRASTASCDGSGSTQPPAVETKEAGELDDRHWLARDQIAGEVRDGLLANEGALRQVMLDLGAGWALRDTPAGSANPFNRAVLRWASGELEMGDAVVSMLSAFADVLAATYLKQPGPSLQVLDAVLREYAALGTDGLLALGSQPRRSNRAIALPWAEDTLFPMPNIQNDGTRNLGLIAAGAVDWQADPSGGNGQAAVINRRVVGRIDFSVDHEAGERKLLDMLRPQAIKALVVTSRLIWERTNHEVVVNQGVTLTIGEIARAMGYKPDGDRKIDPDILLGVARDIHLLSKIPTWAADGPWDPKSKRHPSGWLAPLIVITAIHTGREGPDGVRLPDRFDVMLGRNWAEALLRADILQVAPGFMDLKDPSPILLAWYYLTEFRYRMTKGTAGVNRSIRALCEVAHIDPGESKNRSRFLDRLDGWHAELLHKGVIGSYRRVPAPAAGPDWTPAQIFSEGMYLVEPPAAILDAYRATRQRALARRQPHRRAPRALPS